MDQLYALLLRPKWKVIFRLSMLEITREYAKAKKLFRDVFGQLFKVAPHLIDGSLSNGSPITGYAYAILDRVTKMQNRPTALVSLVTCLTWTHVICRPLSAIAVTKPVFIKHGLREPGKPRSQLRGSNGLPRLAGENS